MRFFTIISMIFICVIIIDTIMATEETDNESTKTNQTPHQGYRYRLHGGGHAARPQIIHGPMIPCPSGQQHDPNELIRDCKLKFKCTTFIEVRVANKMNKQLKKCNFLSKNKNNPVTSKDSRILDNEEPRLHYASKKKKDPKFNRIWFGYIS
ncbi:hypothetical protein V1478_001562 [Vespula squamosa]|uniref:Uncharacterized protein n=1 Tax=Vespula squamosa TaxID=30214 RepID=A0ABD2C1U2_VESSQ